MTGRASDGRRVLLGIIDDVLKQRISPSEFASRFMRAYKRDAGGDEEPWSSIFDEMFATCDAHVDDSELMDEFDLSDAMLLDAVRKIAARLPSSEPSRRR